MKKKMLKNLIMVVIAIVLCFAMNENAAAADETSLSFAGCTGGVMVSNCNDSASGELVIPSYYNGHKVVAIGDWAFDNCMSLTKVVIPEGVTAIGESAFEGCMSLKSIIFPESLKSIGAYAFFCCDALESAQFYPNVSYIGEYAFYECVSLKSVNIPSALTTISEGTFGECSSLEKVTIDSTLKSVDADAFYNCNNLKKVYYSGSMYAWANINFADGNDKIVSRNTENFSHTHTYRLKASEHPDCTQYGKGVYDCECGYIYVDIIAPRGHSEVLVPGYAPTCEVPGLTDGKQCSVCGVITVSQIVIAPTGHAYDAGVVVAYPTCTLNGTRIYTCQTDTSHQLAEAIPALGHQEIVNEAVAPTCISFGLTRGSSCAVCGEVFSVQTVVPMTDHPVQWVYIENPTCLNDGVYTGYCTYCKQNIVIQAPATGHIFGEGQANCAVCGFDRTAGCRCLCHSNNFLIKLVWKMINFVCKFLRFRQFCSCGITHY